MNALTNNLIVKWLKETLQRLFTKSPMFFKIWTIISGALVLITGLPELFDAMSFLNIHIPDLWNAKVTNAIAWASRAAFFMSLLTTQSKITAQTPDGTAVKQTNVKLLPFTAKIEANKVEKEDVKVVNLVTNPPDATLEDKGTSL